MRRECCFALLRLYSDYWTRRHCKVVLSGLEHVESVRHRPRIYIGLHPTTYDVPVMIHLAKRELYFIIAEGPYVHPLVGRVFDGAGFVKLNYRYPRQAIQNAEKLVDAGKPLICSMYGYGTDFGEAVPPETGAIRIAHHTKADIVPMLLMIEDERRIFKWYRGAEGILYPYTYFSNTLFFLTFTKPLRYEDYSKRLDTASVKKKNAEYARIAQECDDLFKAMEQAQRQDLEDKAEYYRSLKRTGGSDVRFDW